MAIKKNRIMNGMEWNNDIHTLKDDVRNNNEIQLVVVEKGDERNVKINKTCYSMCMCVKFMNEGIIWRRFLFKRIC